MKKRKFYKTGVKISSAKSMFNFINNHFTYWTMNSRNRLKSIANNVKLYNLDLDGDWIKVADYLNDEYDDSGLQTDIRDMIDNWEYEHIGYCLGFNGRSGGYLVIYNKQRNNIVNFRNILPEHLTDFNSYDEWKEYIKENCSTVKDVMYELREYTKLIRDFDRLCDDLRDLVNEYSK